MKYYLAYGSNLSVEQMLHRCPSAVYVGTAEIEDYRLLFKSSRSGSYLTIEPMEGRAVPVVVWAVTDADEEALDIYEGYPRFYQKQFMDVTVHSLFNPDLAQEIEAFVYRMDDRCVCGKPSPVYYRVCADGYKRFGFDQNILKRAYNESARGIA